MVRWMYVWVMWQGNDCLDGGRSDVWMVACACGSVVNWMVKCGYSYR